MKSWKNLRPSPLKPGQSKHCSSLHCCAGLWLHHPVRFLDGGGLGQTGYVIGNSFRTSRVKPATSQFYELPPSPASRQCAILLWIRLSSSRLGLAVEYLKGANPHKCVLAARGIQKVSTIGLRLEGGCMRYRVVRFYQHRVRWTTFYKSRKKKYRLPPAKRE